MAPSAVQALDIDPAVVFPAPPIADKRQLVPNLVNGLTTAVGNLGNNVGNLLGATTTTTTTAAAATSPAAVTSATVSTPANNSPAPAATTTSPANNGGNNGNQSSSSNSASGAPAETGPNGKSTTIGGTVVPINHGQDIDSQTRTVQPQVVTDHNGNLLTITAPYTTTYVTTLPNGVISTVTEVITPTSYIAEPSKGGMSPSKIGAVVGTLVTVFLIIFGLALLLLRLRKRRKAIQLTRSRPASASSFGSVTDEFAYEERRSSRALLVNGTNTAPAVVDGSTMNFPLPPAGAANGSSNRPVSMLSNQTFDLAFEQQAKSRSSLIADRNLFRKIGEYPEAGTYTPFAVPPSDTSHAEQAMVSPTQLNRALERQQGYNEVYRVSQTDKQLMAENPFSDPVPASTRSPTYHAQILSNNEARRTTLWRKATFGSDAPSSGVEDTTKSPSMKSMNTSEYGTALSHSEEERRTSDVLSDGGYSYHSAFEAYAQGKAASKEVKNPFADPQPLAMDSADTIIPAKIAYPDLRPGTGASTGNSSIASSIPQSREMGPTPEPKDLFYQSPTVTTPTSSRADVRNSTMSESSIGTTTSDEEGTVRGHSVTYAYPIPPSVARLQNSTAAP